jgi:hypothetical protein
MIKEWSLSQASKILHLIAYMRILASDTKTQVPESAWMLLCFRTEPPPSDVAAAVAADTAADRVVEVWEGRVVLAALGMVGMTAAEAGVGNEMVLVNRLYDKSASTVSEA